MRATVLNRFSRPVLTLIVILLVFFVGGYLLMGSESFVRTTLSGLTLGSLYFMIAAGLTLIFGLMDVLNFAHGTMFMVGAYLGWQFFTNPSFLFGLAPLISALVLGMSASDLLRPYVMKWRVPGSLQTKLPVVLIIAGLAVGVIGMLGFDVLSLSSTAIVAFTVGADPLAEIKTQEALALFGPRVVVLLLAGLVIALGNARPGDMTQVVQRGSRRRGWLKIAGLAVLTLALLMGREAAPVAVLLMDANLRFLLALVVGALAGAGLGAVIEVSLIRPLYIRPLYQVLVTLGLAYVLRELVMLLWNPVAYQMVRPPLFAQPGEAQSVIDWLMKGSSTIDILGVTFPTYRLFIIFLGVVMLVILSLTIAYSRLGMIIRAGVQDREMVEALGINVRRVFTFVFMIGVGLAALGGIGASPFIPIESGMGDTFQLQAFICVVLGGMGSFYGAAVGALLLGLARAFGDYIALRFGLTPSIPEASTVIIMAIVLLVRPAGLFGRRD
jgi:branched-chain amino acid transport system permease protein